MKAVLKTANPSAPKQAKVISMEKWLREKVDQANQGWDFLHRDGPGKKTYWKSWNDFTKEEKEQHRKAVK